MGRPQVRGECELGPRPCPWIGCRHHLLFEINSAGGLQSTSLRRRQGRKPTVHRPTADQVSAWVAGAVARICSARETCSLDVAARGPLEPFQVARLLGLTRRRVSQLEAKVVSRLRALQSPESQRWLEAGLDAGIVDHPEEIDVTKTSETQSHEAAIRQAHAGRRGGTVSPEAAARIVREHNAHLRAKRGSK